jgi:hypothetical protein
MLVAYLLHSEPGETVFADEITEYPLHSVIKHFILFVKKNKGKHSAPKASFPWWSM